MESIRTNIQTSPRTPQRTKTNGTPRSQAPPPPSKRRAQYTPISNGSSPSIGRTQSLSYYLEASANGELDEWEAITNGLCAVAGSESPAQSASVAVPQIPGASGSSQPKQTALTSQPLTNAQGAAQIAQEQSLSTPSAEVFLNLFEAMRTSLVADFRKQYENYQIIISGYQHSNMVKLEDAQKQNTKLRERLVTLEKMRGEERGRWEAEKRHLILSMENGENGLDREGRLRREEEERRQKKDEHDKAMRRLVEKYEAKKKLWATEKEEMAKEMSALLSRVAGLDEENKRLEDIITNDDNVLLEQLEVLENEKSELIGGFDEEKEQWEVARTSLQQELSLARQMVEKLKKERGTLYWDTKKTLIDVQRENETLNETVGELTRRIEWQQKTWDKEKCIMMARLQEERNDIATLRQQLYEREAKRKWDGIQEEEDEEEVPHEQKVKKSRVEDIVNPGGEQDEEDEAGIDNIQEGFNQQDYNDMSAIGLDVEIERLWEENFEEEDRGSEDGHEDGSAAGGSADGSEDEVS